MKPAFDAATSIHNHRTTHLLPMRAFEVITPEANRPTPRLQPKRRGAVSIQKDPEGIPGDPDVVGAKVNSFSFAGRGFKQSVHLRFWGGPFKKLHGVVVRVAAVDRF